MRQSGCRAAILVACLAVLFTVSARASVVLSASPNPAQLGQLVTLKAIVVPPASTGAVTFYDGVIPLGSALLQGGSATLITSALPAGSRSLRATYFWDKSNILTETVNPLPSAVLVPSIGGLVGTILPGFHPTKLATGDFNNDGKADMAIIDFQNNVVNVFLGQGAGNFRSQPTSPYAVGSQPRTVVVGDFNGDGKPDLAVTNWWDGTISILLGDGTGAFTAAAGSPVWVGPGATGLAVADFNGDGKADLAVSNDLTNTVQLLAGNGSGGFTQGNVVAVGVAPEFLAVGDFNGDGNPDLAVANNSSSTLSVFLGDGVGNLHQVAGSPFQTDTNPVAIVVADFNGDGAQDIAVLNYNGRDITVLLGDGSGFFWPASGSPFLAGNDFATLPSSMGVLDFDGDGVPDLVVLDGNSNWVWVVHGNGDGTFQQGTSFYVHAPSSGAVSPDSLVVADFDNNGRADVAVTWNMPGGSSSGYSLVMGTSAVTFKFSTQPVSSPVGTIPPVVVQMQDAQGNLVTAPDQLLSVWSNPSGVVIGSSTPANTTGGVATFSSLSFNTPGVYTLYVAGEALRNDVSVPFSIGPATATHLTVAAPASAAAGGAFPITVTALDQNNHTVTGYSGTVHFSSSDTSATLPADATLSNGAMTFSATLRTIGEQTITAVDTVSPGLTGTSGYISVSGGAATHFLVSPQSGAVAAGDSFSFTVTAQDQSGYTASGYAGTVHFSSSDPQASLNPGATGNRDATLTNGTGTFRATLYTLGQQTITAVDTGNASIAGTSSAIAVSPGTAVRFRVSAPSSATGGVAFQVTVTALDAGNNTATGYSGTFQFTSTDHHATLPASPALVNGLGTFTVTLRTAGNWTITAAVAGEIEGTSGTIQVNAAPASHYSVQAPGLATAGTPISFTVTALDPSNNIVTGYTGTVHFGSSDPTAAVPANATLTNGTGTFQATLKTIGTQNVSATDVAVTTIVGSSGAITVGAAAATHFNVTAPASAVAGASFSFAVKALDAFNNTASAYAGTVHFTSSDGAAAVPANTTLAAGAGSFQATLVTPGNQTIAAADAVNGSIAGVSNAIAVSLGLPARLRFITQPANSAVGAVLAAVVVEVDDAGGNLVSGSQAPITISSTPPGVNGTLTSRAVNGVATFSNLEIDTAGTYTLTAGATGLTAATSNPFIIGAAAPVQLRVATQPRNGTAGLPMSPVVVEVRDSGGNLLTNSSAAVTITSTPSGVAGTVTVSAVNGVATFLDLTITRSGAYTLTAAAPGLPAANSAPFTIGGGPAASLTFDVPPPYPPTVVAGKTFPLKLRAIDQYNNTATGYSGTVHFTSGDSGASLPADATLTGGAGTFNVTLRAVGDAMWVNAADTTTSSITTGSFQIRVVTAANTHLVVTAPATVAVADTFQFTITAADPSGNPVSYTGNVTLTSTDPVAAIPSGAAFGTPVTFSGYMKTAGNQTITVTDNSDASITGTSNVMAVSPGPLYDVAVSAPASAAVGAGFPVTARAQDQFGNTVTGWSGIAHFTSSDASAVLPGDVSMVNGSGGATATLNTAGNQTVTAALAGTNIRGDSGPISVGGAAATHFAVSAGAIQTAGTPFGFTVTALDPLNIPATNYARPLNFSSTDAAAVLPSTGLQAQNLPATLNTPGIQTITARDSSNALLTGTSGPISVRSAANATHFSFVAPTSATAGTAFSFTVSALDASNHVATGYADTVHFTSSDAAAILPADAMLTNGTATFIATLRTAGNQTLTVTDVVLPSMHNSAGPIAVAPAAASQFAVTAPLNVVSGTAFTFAVKAQDAFRNLVPGYAGTVHFSTNARSATVPVNSTLLNGAGSFTATIVDGGLTVAITATDMGNGAITGASSLIDCQYLLTITVSPPGSGTVTGAGLYDETRLVTPTATANPGFLFQFFTDASSGQIVDRVSMDPNQNLVANFKALAPALVATIASRTDGPATGQRTWTLTIGNSGAGTALGTSITAITTAVNGVVQTGIAPPLPIPVGDIAPGASKPVPVTLNLAGVAATARITLTLTITANGGGYTATPAITQFR